LHQANPCKDAYPDVNLTSLYVQPSRVGISVSLKVNKRAVVRNRLKRQIKAAIRQLLPRILAGWQLVIVVHPQAKECEYVDFLQELEQLLLAAEVMHGH
jgi:ribonuclease P protein component